MKKCGYCDSTAPKSFMYCSAMCEMLAEVRDVGEENSRRREEEQQPIPPDADRDFKIVRSALTTLKGDSHYPALCQLALEALERIERGEK